MIPKQRCVKPCHEGDGSEWAGSGESSIRGGL